MSAFHSVVDALTNDPELRERVMSATDPDDRAAILREAGVPVPTEEEIEAARADLEGVSGGNGTNGTPTTGATASLIACSAACTG